MPSAFSAMLYLDRHVALPQPEARHASDSRLRALLGHSPAVLYACMPGDPQLTYVSDSVGDLLGYRPEQLLGDPGFWSRHVHPDDAHCLQPATARAFTDGRRSIEYRMRHANGDYLWVQDDLRLVRDAAGTPLELVGSIVDIGARKAAEAEHRALLAQLSAANHELLQSQKMASIGQLAAGIAHEINNPLGFINSNLGTLHGYFTDLVRLLHADEQAAGECGANADLRERMAFLRRQAELDYLEKDAGELVAESLDGVRRMRDTVRALMDFSRPADAAPAPADLDACIDAALAALPAQLKARATVLRDAGGLPAVTCHARQMEDVFRHLLRNALQAVEEGGNVAVTARLAGSSASVTVADDGCGIAGADLGRIFDPFFTTRPVGSGTGLGLALCYGVVTRHGGRIEVDSSPGAGSRFTVHLPLSTVTG